MPSPNGGRGRAKSGNRTLRTGARWRGRCQDLSLAEVWVKARAEKSSTGLPCSFAFCSLPMHAVSSFPVGVFRFFLANTVRQGHKNQRLFHLFYTAGRCDSIMKGGRREVAPRTACGLSGSQSALGRCPSSSKVAQRNLLFFFVPSVPPFFLFRFRSARRRSGHTQSQRLLHLVRR